MYIAQLHNKFKRAEEDMEDLLTSNVFGVWKYLPPHLGLQQFLGTAQRLDETMISLGDIVKADLIFWPWYKHSDIMLGGEPDILIALTTSLYQNYLVLIESKFHSDKSSFADISSNAPLPTDQLAREMQILRHEAHKLDIENYALIYVTADPCLPGQDFQESISELSIKTGQDGKDNFYWTSWRKLTTILNNKNLLEQAQGVALGYMKILTDLDLILHRLGLTFFEGFNEVSHIGSGISGWNYHVPPVSFTWSSTNLPRFEFKEKVRTFDWVSLDRMANVLWRFNQNAGNWSRNPKGIKRN